VRRVILDLLRCPRCQKGSLAPESNGTEVVFGPVRCRECQASYPVGEGVVDLVGDRAPSEPLLQRGLEHPLVARSFEQYVRPALNLALSRRRLDRDSEFLLFRSLLTRPDAPILDLGCGTGLFARRLARDPELPSVLAMDLSKPMIEEGVAQAREAGVRVDFVRAEAPHLPFMDHSLGAVLQSSALHLMPDLERLLIEVGRVLRPKGRYVASTYLPPGMVSGFLQKAAGLHPRGEDELRSAIAAAGLVRFERILLPPLIVVKAERD
jgi:SAM-dependent methyltransferase